MIMILERKKKNHLVRCHVLEKSLPKHVSKLKTTYMLASMGSKSLLKGDIEKVDKANAEEATDADLKARSPIPSQGRKNPRKMLKIKII
jgi:hypothetical protein